MVLFFPMKDNAVLSFGRRSNDIQSINMQHIYKYTYYQYWKQLLFNILLKPI